MEEIDIFYEATGLSKLDDRVLRAAYKVYRYLKDESVTLDSEARYSEIEIMEVGSVDLREVIMIISNLESLVSSYGFHRIFSLREASQTMGVTPTIASRWLEKAISIGLIESEEVEGEIRYKVSKKNFFSLLDSIKGAVDKLRIKLEKIDEEKPSKPHKSSFPEKTKGAVNTEEEFKEIIAELEKAVNNVAERNGVDLGLSYIQKVRELTRIIGGDLSMEIVNCFRLSKLASLNQIEVSEEDVTRCKSALERLELV